MRNDTMKYLYYRNSNQITNQIIGKDSIRLELKSGKVVQLKKGIQLLTFFKDEQSDKYCRAGRKASAGHRFLSECGCKVKRNHRAPAS